MTSTQVRVQLLNGFSVSVDGQPVCMLGGSQRLVAYLAIMARPVERTKAAFVLWPDKHEERALANLRTSVWRLTKVGAPLVAATRTHVHLEPTVQVDAHDDFDATAVAAMPMGELLPDWYDDWLTVERERLRQRCMHSLEAAARQLTIEGRHTEAVDVGIRAVALDPMRESAHRVVIEAHLAEGNVAEACRQFDLLRTTLQRELGVDPSHQTSELLRSPSTSSSAGPRPLTMN